MSFRVLSAWISLVSVGLVFGAYFLRVAQVWAGHGPIPRGELLGQLIGSIVLVTILQIALTVVIAIRRPKEAQAPADERERSVDLQATRISYFVLLIGVIAVALGMWFVVDPFMIANAALAAMVIAELSRFSSQIVISRIA